MLSKLIILFLDLLKAYIFSVCKQTTFNCLSTYNASLYVYIYVYVYISVDILHQISILVSHGEGSRYIAISSYRPTPSRSTHIFVTSEQ